MFQDYVRHVLLPTLRPGDIVVMDNLSAHKDTEAIDLITSIGADVRRRGAEVRSLPPYSPGFNPIEKMWSKVKEFLRDAKARTQAALFNAIAAALNTVTPQDAMGWFASCGYVSSHY